MLNKLNKFLYSSIIISIIMFIIGLIFIIYPEVSFTTITYILSILLNSSISQSFLAFSSPNGDKIIFLL